jgi:diacylglycerol kinase (ATP)
VPDKMPEQSGPVAFDKAANTGFKHFKNATRFSINGLTMAYRNEAAFRQELGLFVISIPLAIWLGSSPLQWAALIGVGMIVLIVELLNSGIEACIDRIGTEHHPLSGLAKDFGSAAVMLALALACLVWAACLAERMW